MYIPSHNFRVNLKQAKRASIDSDLRTLVRRKKILWIRFLETRNNNKYEEYSKVRNEVRKVTRRNQQRREHYLAEHAQQEPKMFRTM